MSSAVDLGQEVKKFGAQLALIHATVAVKNEIGTLKAIISDRDRVIADLKQRMENLHFVMRAKDEDLRNARQENIILENGIIVRDKMVNNWKARALQEMKKAEISTLFMIGSLSFAFTMFVTMLLKIL